LLDEVIRRVGDYTLRMCSAAEIPSVILVNEKTLPEHYSDVFYYDILDSFPEGFLAVETAGTLVGYLMLRVEFGFSNIKGFSLTKKGHVVSVAVLKEHQLDVVRHLVTHIDLQEIRLDEPIESTVAIVVEGTSVGVKQGGLLDMLTHEVTVNGLPGDIPDHVTLDVTPLAIGDHGRVADLIVPDGVTVLDDAEYVICSVLAPRVVEEEEVEEAAAEAAPAEPGLVGEEAEGGAGQGEE